MLKGILRTTPDRKGKIYASCKHRLDIELSQFEPPFPSCKSKGLPRKHPINHIKNKLRAYNSRRKKDKYDAQLFGEHQIIRNVNKICNNCTIYTPK